MGERVRNAAALKYLHNVTDAKIAEAFKVSPHTIADWKKRKEWVETVKELSEHQFGETFSEIRAMAPAAREVLFELMRDGPPAVRMKIAQTICEWATKTQW